MKMEKNVIIYSILALTVGISSVIPLVFLMNTSATVKADTTNEPWFSFEIPYVYWVTSDDGIIEPYLPDLVDPIEPTRNETDYYSEKHMIVLNLTLNTDTTNKPVDAQFEYYKIDISSDKGLIQTMPWTVGTNSNPDFNITGIIGRFSFMRNEWFDTGDFTFPTYGNGGGMSRQNWELGLSRLWPEAGYSTGTKNNNSLPHTVSMLREAETVFIKVYRVGWVTFSENTTQVTLANNEIIEEIQLQKHSEEEWIYNNLISEAELTTVDIADPIGLLKK